MANTKIQWADKVWNPVTGCTPVSLGCQNCYAKRFACRLREMGTYPDDSRHPFDIRIWPDRFEQPLRWKKPCRIFVCSMGDLFHEQINMRGKEIEDIFRIMSCCEHTFLLLTKRPERMGISLKYFYDNNFAEQMDNVWLGVSCENQEWAEKRIPKLLDIPAAIHWLSLEPLLGSMSLFNEKRDWLTPLGRPGAKPVCPGIDFVVIGCESGPNRRPCKIEWVRDIVRQCQAADVSLFIKQLSLNGKVSHNLAEWPEDLRIRQYPEAPT